MLSQCGGRIPLPPDAETVRQGVTFRVLNKAVSVRVLSINDGKDKAVSVRVLRCDDGNDKAGAVRNKTKSNAKLTMSDGTGERVGKGLVMLVIRWCMLELR